MEIVLAKLVTIQIRQKRAQMQTRPICSCFSGKVNNTVAQFSTAAKSQR